MSNISYSNLNSAPNYGGVNLEAGTGYCDNFSSYNKNPDTRHDSCKYYDSCEISLANKLSRSDTSGLMKEFFSDSNIKRLQKIIKSEVDRRSNGIFKITVDQDRQDLLLAMESIYVEHGRNLPTGIVRQTKILNNKLIDDIVPGILTAIKQYYGYMKDISTPVEPIARPMNVNNAGRQGLPSITTLWQDRGYADNYEIKY